MGDQSDKVLQQLMGLESLREIEQFVRARRAAALRQALFRLLDERVEYRHAQDWGEVVRICESLAIIGWEDRERVDAICERNENQWLTRFLAEHEKIRFLAGNWTKCKQGFRLHNPEYRESPDRPGKPDVDWMTYGRRHSAEFRTVPCDILPSQRNARRPCPVRLGAITARDRTSRVVDEHRLSLSRRLQTSILGDSYGMGLKTLDICFVTWSSEGPLKPGLQAGRYSAKSELYRCYLNFEKSFHNRARSDQKAFIASNLLAAIDHATALLRQRLPGYDMAALQADVERVVQEWLVAAE